MDSEISWDGTFTSIQPRQIPSNDHLPNTNTDTPRNPSSEEGELMKQVLELKEVVRELKVQIAANTAPSHQIPQALGAQNVHQSQIGTSSGGGSKRAVESDTTTEGVPLQPIGKRRRLNYSRCTFCRKDKKKCSPDNRIWPGQKCDRCARMGLDCSASVTKKAGGEDRATRAKQRNSSKEDQSHHEQEQSLFDWQDLYQQPQYMDYPYPPSTGAQGPISNDLAMMYSVPPVLQTGSAPYQDNNQAQVRVVQSRPKPQCWEHECKGRQFSTFSKLLRHQREKSGQAIRASCRTHYSPNHDTEIGGEPGSNRDDVSHTMKGVSHTEVPGGSVEDRSSTGGQPKNTPHPHQIRADAYDPRRQEAPVQNTNMPATSTNPEEKRQESASMSTAFSDPRAHQPNPFDVLLQAAAVDVAHRPDDMMTMRLVCPSCNEEVNTKSELKKHKQRHEKPHYCLFMSCSRSEGFSTLNDVARHMRACHGVLSDGTPRYRCTVQGCRKADKIWPRMDNFRQHLKRVHDLVMSDEGIDVFLYKSPGPKPLTPGADGLAHLRDDMLQDEAGTNLTALASHNDQSGSQVQSKAVVEWKGGPRTPPNNLPSQTRRWPYTTYRPLPMEPALMGPLTQHHSLQTRYAASDIAWGPLQGRATTAIGQHEPK